MPTGLTAVNEGGKKINGAREGPLYIGKYVSGPPNQLINEVPSRFFLLFLC